MSNYGRIEPFEAYTLLKRHFGPQGWWPTTRKGETIPRYHPGVYRAIDGERFEICAGAILTQNTSWKNVEKALGNLSGAGALSIERLGAMGAGAVARLIRPSGYYRQKAQRLKDFVSYVAVTCAGDLGAILSRPLPLARRELLSLSGIGPETADSMLLYAGNRRTFVIDAYTRRLGARLGWHNGGEYHSLKRFYEANLPPSFVVYNEFHALIVALGKDCCRTRPVCAPCPLRRRCGGPHG